MKKSSWNIFLGIAATLVITGCGPPMGNVSGTVSYKGKKVSGGTVTFLVNGQVAEVDIEDGTYKIQSLPVGTATVTVFRLDPDLPDPRAPLRAARKTSAESGISVPAKNVVSDPYRLETLEKKRHLLPYRYASPSTSNLRCTISGGPNTFDITLSDDDLSSKN